MSFLFVDRILENTPGQHIVGLKFVTSNDAYLIGSKDGPIFMPSLIGETLGQLAAWSVIDAANYEYRPVAGVASDVEISGHAKIGDVIHLESWIDRWDTQAVEYHSIARVNDHVIFTITNALGPMLPLTDFSDPEVVRREFAKINRPGKYSPLPITDETLIWTASRLSGSYAAFDHILEWEPGTHAKAVKLVSLSAPFFPDHFARKPVLPLTILLQAKTELAQNLLMASRDETWRLKRFEKVKMNGFVQPGDALMCQAVVKNQTESEAQVLFTSTVDEQRVCVALALFVKEPA